MIVISESHILYKGKILKRIKETNEKTKNNERNSSIQYKGNSRE